MILSILDMEQRHPMDDTADFHAALRDVAGRIGGMATVHRMLSSAQWAPLNLDQVVAKVIHAALSGSPIQHRVEVVVDAPHDPPRLTSRQAIAVALVINELTTNSVKHAFQGRSQGQIHVRIATVGDERDERNQVRMVFRDDGPGMPDEVLAGERHRGGLWLVDTNVKHTLGGEITRRNDGGAVASITFEQAILGFRCT
jgi:two-component sensor histidine kinase